MCNNTPILELEKQISVCYDATMKRLAQEHLKQWFNKKNRMPMIIRGARQVGKSTLVQLFCDSEKIQLIEINLEKSKLRSLNDDEFNLTNVLDEIQMKAKKKITQNTILFLDEIQDAPKLLKALRYFYEERPDIAVIAAGSLLEFVLKGEDFSFPVGRVEFYNLGPMNFLEFLWATGNELLADKLESLDFSEPVCNLAKAELQKYYYVGGMPMAVKTYILEKSLIAVREVQNQLLETYVADFPKYNARIQSEKIQRIFYSCILFLGKKIIYQKLEPDLKSREIKKILELLIDARIVTPCIHTNANTVPLMGESDTSIFKIYFLDIGLLNALMRLDFETIDDEFKNSYNSKGLLTEQFIAQHLCYLDGPGLTPQLHYWLRDKGSQKGEVDFIVAFKNLVVPVEVKTREAGHLKSLFYFCNDKNKKVAINFSLDDFSIKETGHKIDNKMVTLKLLRIPHFAVMQVKKIFEQNTK